MTKGVQERSYLRASAKARPKCGTNPHITELSYTVGFLRRIGLRRISQKQRKDRLSLL